MLFFKYTFLFVFLPLMLAGYYAAPRRARNAVLLVSSCVFYTFSSLNYMPLLFTSIVVDYLAARRIAGSEHARTRRAWLALSVTCNMSLLGYFKYAGLITSTLRDVFSLQAIPLLHAMLPAGISFYTFQSMSYTIDVYRRQVAPARRFGDFATYVTMFPQLIAGPIVRFAALHDQILRRSYTLERFAHGVFFVVVGIAKKLLVADAFALLSNPLFNVESPTLLQAWTSMALFAGQIYFDFSGYSDMAIGLGAMLGFTFPANFDAPYKADSFSDFWRRWHITLSTWLRDYLYIPLGGNRHGAARTYANLMLTMLLGGLWHGASWNFVLWGFVHGAYLVVERALGPRVGWLRWPAALRRAIVLLAVIVAWVPFKLDGMAQTWLWLSAMFGMAPLGTIGIAPLLGVCAFLALVWLPENSTRWRVSLSPAQTVWALGLLAASILVGYGRVSSSPFLYFRF